MQSFHSKVNQGKYNIPRQSIDSKFQQDEYLVVLVNKSEGWIIETATGRSQVKPPLVAYYLAKPSLVAPHLAGLLQNHYW